MPDTPTPGQVAYEAYVGAASPVVGDALMRWEETNARYRAIWEAAAQAVQADAGASPRLCAVGTALEALRDTTCPQGALWLRLDAVLAQLDAVIDTLAAPTADGGCARRAARKDEAREEDAP